MLFVIFPLLLLIFFLSIFVSLITMYLSMFLLGFILPGTLCTSRILQTVPFPILGKFSAIITSNIFSSYFSPSSPPETHIMWMLVHLKLSQRSLMLSLFVFILFYLFRYTVVISIILPSRSLISSSASVILLILYSVFLNFSYCIIHLCLFVL